jgi:hypothetical protein
MIKIEILFNNDIDKYQDSSHDEKCFLFSICLNYVETIQQRLYIKKNFYK